MSTLTSSNGLFRMTARIQRLFFGRVSTIRTEFPGNASRILKTITCAPRTVCATGSVPRRRRRPGRPGSARGELSPHSCCVHSTGSTAVATRTSRRGSYLAGWGPPNRAAAHGTVPAVGNPSRGYGTGEIRSTRSGTGMRSRGVPGIPPRPGWPLPESFRQSGRRRSPTTSPHH